jgi:hypothetical protein
MTEHYDIIVVGSGPGGASAAQRLAPTGKRILMLERGDYLPRSRQNWDSMAVFVDGIYQTKENWYGSDGRTFHPGLHYFVGGLIVGFTAGAITLVVGQAIFASPVLRGLIALIFATPAAVAGYHATLALARIGVPAGGWREVFAIVGAIAIGGTAVVRVAGMAYPSAVSTPHESKPLQFLVKPP